MARTTGPLLSMDASGSVGNALTFAKWKGRNYVRRWAVPSNPRTFGQVSIRTGMALYNILAQADDPALTPYYVEQGQALKISPFNAFIREALRLWKSNIAQFPSTDQDASATVTAGFTSTATAGTRNVALAWVPTDIGTPAAFLILRDTAATPQLNFTRAYKALPGGATAFTDTSVDVGTQYYYRILSFAIAGNMFASAAGITATPTA